MMADYLNICFVRFRKWFSSICKYGLVAIVFIVAVWVSANITMFLTGITANLLDDTGQLRFLQPFLMFLPGVLYLSLNAFLTLKSVNKKRLIGSTFWSGSLIGAEFIVCGFGSLIFFE
jgi:hypothetical protein